MSKFKKGKPKIKKKSKKGYRKSLVKGKAAYVVFSFVLLLFIGLFCLYHIRDDIRNLLLQKELHSKAEFLDKTIAEKLFELGIDKRYVLKKKVEKKSKDNVSWDYKEISFRIANPGIKEKIVSEVRTLASDAGVKTRVLVSKVGLDVFFDVEGYRTHKLTFLLGPFRKENTGLPPKNRDSRGSEVASRSRSSDIQSVPTKPFRRPKVAIIVDDLGRDKNSIDTLAEISENLTVAILPYLPHSIYTAEAAKRNGMEILLHLPMEPKLTSGYSADDAGLGVLMVGQPKQEVLSSLEEDIESIPYITGVNNHMGSKFTENYELMTLVLKRLKEKNLFFVDSKTSPDSRGPDIAKRIGLKFTTRDIFLDKKTLGKEYVLKQLDRLVERSYKKGYAVGICHPYPQTIEALKRGIPELSKHVEIVPVSKILNYSN